MTVIGLGKIGLVKPGDDVSRLIFDAIKAERLSLRDGDVVVISQKIVSKAQGLLTDISRIKPSTTAKSLSRRTRKDPRLVELILLDSAKVLRADSQALIVKRRDGLICLNAGVDKSNVKGPLIYSQLPKDSDYVASQIRRKLERFSGRRLGVMVADTYSRPFRVGQVEFAIGVSGFEPLVDYRGQQDIFGYSLKFKFVGLADEIAAAAELVMGQGTERIPVAIVRGVTRLRRSDARSLAKRLLLGRKRDLFRVMA